MTLLTATTAEAAHTPSPRTMYRSGEELRMRTAVERWGRAKWPDARVCHELVMARGEVRADVAFVCPDHLAVAEIKSSWDTTKRLIYQAAMFRLASSELWICCATRHVEDAELVRFMLPSIGVVRTDLSDRFDALPSEFVLTETSPAERHEPHPEAMLRLLWVEELFDEARRAGLVSGRARPRHDKLVTLLRHHLSPTGRIKAVCRQLRGRDAFWRADPPVTERVR